MGRGISGNYIAFDFCEGHLQRNLCIKGLSLFAPEIKGLNLSMERSWLKLANIHTLLYCVLHDNLP